MVNISADYLNIGLGEKLIISALDEKTIILCTQKLW